MKQHVTMQPCPPHPEKSRTPRDYLIQKDLHSNNSKTPYSISYENKKELAKITLSDFDPINAKTRGIIDHSGKK